MVFEDLTIGLIIILAAATTVAIYIGLLGMVGQLYVVRCATCRHMTFSSTDAAHGSCALCRDPGYLHPWRHTPTG